MSGTVTIKTGSLILKRRDGQIAAGSSIETSTGGGGGGSAVGAEEMMNALKEIDGTGCGLDADLVDGKEASDFCLTNDSRLSDARQASDVYSWAKAASKPSYDKSEVGLGNVDNTPDDEKNVYHAALADSADSANDADTVDTKHASDFCLTNDSRLSDARPASDVYSWAKAAIKPSYDKSEVGLGNVDNTADANKSVSQAAKLVTTDWTIEQDGVTGNLLFKYQGTTKGYLTTAGDLYAVNHKLI